MGFPWGFQKPETQARDVTHGKNSHTLHKLTVLAVGTSVNCIKRISMSFFSQMHVFLSYE